ncbi:MAG: hypothetical protein HC836_28130 [Richelia sp. RM2_1_2]|nr:hypothetical protein [Richelia sp. RM2_1_2]
MILLDLHGTIIKKFNSGSDLARFIGIKTQLTYGGINTKAIIKKQFRVVTPEFFRDHIDEIRSWKSISNVSNVKILKRYFISNNFQNFQFENLYQTADFLNITYQYVSLLLKEKKTYYGCTISMIRKKIIKNST